MRKFIDEVDSKIICCLQENGRMAFTAIAKELSLSEATVRTRVQRLLDNEVIQIVAVGNPRKLGFGAEGYVHLNIEPTKVNSILEELKKIEEIWYITLSTGSTEINIDFCALSLDELQHIVYDRISQIDGITKTGVSIILDYYKRTYTWGTSYTSKFMDNDKY